MNDPCSSVGPDSANDQVPVSLGDRSYTITLAAGLLQRCGAALEPWVAGRQVLLISDEQVGPLYRAPVETSLAPLARRVDVLQVPVGETSKSVAQCEALWQQLLSLGADRDAVVVALGGGVVGDLAGFVAATFGRGIDFIQIPTSLLAQVDSSVGGKVGINLPAAKNMVGAFWQPRAVLIDPQVLQTLDAANYSAGLAEVIKYGVIMDAPFFEWLEARAPELDQRRPADLIPLIAQSCRCKARIVEQDETESSGLRAILNYGHTFGHALETVFGYGAYLHGEAVAIGMTCAARLAVRLGLADTEMLDRQTRLLKQVGLPTEWPHERHDELLAAMHRDKKVARGVLHLILPTRIGEVQRMPAPPDDQLLASFQPLT